MSCITAHRDAGHIFYYLLTLRGKRGVPFSDLPSCGICECAAEGFEIMAVPAGLLTACVLSLLLLTLRNLQAQKYPVVHAVKEGVHQLAVGDLETTAAEIKDYIFYKILRNFTENSINCRLLKRR